MENPANIQSEISQYLSYLIFIFRYLTEKLEIKITNIHCYIHFLDHLSCALKVSYLCLTVYFYDYYYLVLIKCEIKNNEATIKKKDIHFSASMFVFNLL